MIRPRRVALRRLATRLAVPVLGLALSACVSLLPKTKPDQLYSFGHGVEAAPAASAAPGPGAVGVLLGAVTFPRAATGDGILSVTGTQSAYLAQSRWVAPAAVLFREAVERSFGRQAKSVRLITRGETGRVGLVLRVDVRDFAVLYPNGPESIPTVAVSLRTRLDRADGQPVDEKSFDVRTPASENRVGPIIAAFDQATAEALTGVVAWTDQAAAAAGPAATVRPAVVSTTTTVQPAR
ncbi:MAG TPA: ABC-type transport auxiliary lipoprotein family protein [Caulobacteraceae bacterium]|nr:ABC-type transport auxiliary lipoprotein family protein [Caulobacteraceae bacterium]